MGENIDHKDIIGAKKEAYIFHGNDIFNVEKTGKLPKCDMVLVWGRKLKISPRV